MPAATCKNELISVTQAEFEKLSKLLADYPEELWIKPDEDGASPKDILGHRAHWIDLFLGWYTDGKAGRTVELPAPGYKWNQLKAYNADLRRKQSTLSWPQAVTMLLTAHGKLISFVEELDNAQLYDGPMQGGNNKWPTGRWAEAAGSSHYRSAAKYLRKRKRDLAKLESF